ncbi:hypothetical protein LguiA_026223 [Lonicera macranthoides]
MYNNVPCLVVPGYNVYAIYSTDDIDSDRLTFCTKIHDIASVRFDIFDAKIGGRKNTNTKANTNQVYFSEWIYDHLDKGKELQIHIEEDGDAIVMKKLTIVGLWCIQWYPEDHPSIKEVVQMLEGEGENMSMPPNPFTAATKRKLTNAGPHGRVVEKKLSVILE